MRAKSMFRMSGSILAVGIAFPACAQTAVPAAAPAQTPAAAPRADNAGISDIVVTARRRAEASQTVPATITAISNQVLKDRDISSTEQLAQIAPGLNITGQKRDEAQFSIRGQGAGVILTGARNFTSVATYFADVPIPVSGPGTFFDLQSVQILKGPQGTLFGRNTTGGAVLLEPNRPTDRFEGYVEATFGNYDRREIEGVINVPFGDLGGLRLSTQVQDRDGFTTNVTTGQKLDGRNYQSFRGSLLLKPVPGVESLTIADYINKNQSGSSEIIQTLNGNAVISPNVLAGTPLPPLPLYLGSGASNRPSVACLSAPTTPGCPPGGAAGAIGAAYAAGGVSFFPTAALNGVVAEQQALGIRKVAFPGEIFDKELNIGFTNKTTWDINDNLTIKNIVAYREQRTNTGDDYDGTALPIVSVYNTTDQKWQYGQNQFTEEFQLQGSFGSSFKYIAGAYHESSRPGVANPEFEGFALGQQTIKQITNDDTSNALFVHGELHITRALQLSGGFRYTWDTRLASIGQTDFSGVCNQLNPETGAIQCPIDYKAKFKAPTYDATIQYSLTNRAMVYAAFRHGFKSGGFNLPAPTPALTAFGPETVDDFEIGLKGDWNIGVPLRTNISLYHDNYKNIQTTVPLVVNGAPASVAINTGRNTNQGVDFDAAIVPIRHFTLTGYLSYLDAHADQTIPGVVLQGLQNFTQPKWTYGATGRYDVPVGGDSDVAFQASYSYVGRVNTADYLAPANLSSYPGYGKIDARIEWNGFLRKDIDLAVFGTNLTNKTYIIGGYPLYSDLGVDTVFYGEPRMYGVSVRVHFGR